MASLLVGAVNLKLFCNLVAVYKIGERFFGRLALICIQISFASLPLVHSLYVVRKAQGAVSCVAPFCEEQGTAEGWNFGILSAMLHENYWIVRKRALRQGEFACREPVPAIPVTGSAALPEVHPAVSPEQSRKAFPGNCAGQSYVSRPETEWAGSARPYR